METKSRQWLRIEHMAPGLSHTNAETQHWTVISPHNPLQYRTNSQKRYFANKASLVLLPD